MRKKGKQVEVIVEFIHDVAKAGHCSVQLLPTLPELHQISKNVNILINKLNSTCSTLKASITCSPGRWPYIQGFSLLKNSPYGTERCLLRELCVTGALCPPRQAGNAEELFHCEVQSSLGGLDPEAAQKSISSCPGCEYRAAQLRYQLRL